MSRLSAASVTPLGAENQDPPEPLSAQRSPRRVSVEEGYELWAPTYDRDPNPALTLEERQLLPRLPGLQEKYVLDVACGTGRWLEKLLRRGARSGAGVDFAPGMLAAAAGKPRLRGRLLRADCLSLPFRSQVADLVICSFALAHLRDLAALARELARVAKRGADVFVTDLHPEAYARGWQTRFRHRGETLEISTLPRPVAQILETFASHGFELRAHLEAGVDEPEKPIFVRAGRSRTFEEARTVPVVLICHLVRL